MKRLSAPLIALALFAFAGTNARAGILWEYDWNTSTASIPSDSGHNSITLTNQPLLSANGDTNVIATNLSVVTPFVGSSDTWTSKPYTLTLKILDHLSLQSAILTFQGEIVGSNGPTGTVTPNSSTLSNMFLGSMNSITNVFTTAMSQTVTLGGNTYTVNNFIASDIPQPGGIAAAISARVTVEGGTTGGKPPTTSPEPSTLVLSCFGLSLLGLASWRRFRNRCSEAASV